MSETSMSMSLAEGIIKRDIRSLKEKAHTLKDVLQIVDSFKVRMMTGKKKTKYIEDILNDFQGMWSYKVIDGKKVKYTYELWLIRESKSLDLVELKLSKGGGSYEFSLFGLSFHALSRCCYRERLKNLKEVMMKCTTSTTSISLIIAQIVTSDEPIERYLQVESGFLIVKQFDDKCCRAVTYVDHEKADAGQRLENSNSYQIMLGLAESKKMDPKEYVKDYLINYETSKSMTASINKWRDELFEAGGNPYNDDRLAEYILECLKDRFGDKKHAEPCN